MKSSTFFQEQAEYPERSRHVSSSEDCSVPGTSIELALERVQEAVNKRRLETDTHSTMIEESNRNIIVISGPVESSMVIALSEIQVRIQDPRWGRFVGLTIACAFLNIGLYFLAYFLTPLIAGVVTGYLLGHKKQSPASGAFGALIAYPALFAYVALTTTFVSGPVEILAASLILAGIGVIGGVIGMLLRGTKIR